MLLFWIITNKQKLAAQDVYVRKYVYPFYYTLQIYYVLPLATCYWDKPATGSCGQKLISTLFSKIYSCLYFFTISACSCATLYLYVYLHVRHTFSVNFVICQPVNVWKTPVAQWNCAECSFGWKFIRLMAKYRNNLVIKQQSLQ